MRVSELIDFITCPNLKYQREVKEFSHSILARIVVEIFLKESKTNRCVTEKEFLHIFNIKFWQKHDIKNPKHRKKSIVAYECGRKWFSWYTNCKYKLIKTDIPFLLDGIITEYFHIPVLLGNKNKLICLIFDNSIQSTAELNKSIYWRSCGLAIYNTLKIYPEFINFSFKKSQVNISCLSTNEPFNDKTKLILNNISNIVKNDLTYPASNRCNKCEYLTKCFI